MMCPKCGEHDLVLSPIETGTETIYITTCCSSDLNELIADYNLELEGITIEQTDQQLEDEQQEWL